MTPDDRTPEYVADGYGVVSRAGRDLVAEHSAGVVGWWDIDTFAERVAGVERAAAQGDSLREALRLRAGLFVARHWRDAVMASDDLRRTGMSHPIACVIAALEGETNPRELGLPEDADAEFVAALDREAGR